MLFLYICARFLRCWYQWKYLSVHADDTQRMIACAIAIYDSKLTSNVRTRIIQSVKYILNV